MAICTVIKEANCFAYISTTTSSSNSVYVVFNGGRKIKVNNMLNVFNIQTSCCHWSCHENWTFPRTKILKSYFSLSLFSISTKTSIVRMGVSKNRQYYLRYKLKGHDSWTEVVLGGRGRRRKGTTHTLPVYVFWIVSLLAVKTPQLF